MAQSAARVQVRKGLTGVSVVAAGVIALAGCSGSPAHRSPASTATAASSAPASATATTSATAPSAGSATGHTSHDAVSGGINQTVAAGHLRTAAPRSLRAQASFGSGVTSRLTAVRAINAKPRGVGEVGGPALAITVQIKNASRHAISLDSVETTLTDSVGDPTTAMIGSPSRPFRGALAAGRSGTGVYVFSVPVAHRNPVTISLSYTTAAPVVLFKGRTA